MVKKHYRLFWICILLIVAITGCDSTKNSNDASNFQLTVVASPTAMHSGEFSAISATLNSVETSVATGTSTTTTTPVSGHAVTFKITQNTSGGTLTVVNNITDASGNATALYQAGTGLGADIIQTSIDSGQTATASITVN